MRGQQITKTPSYRARRVLRRAARVSLALFAVASSGCSSFSTSMHQGVVAPSSPPEAVAQCDQMLADERSKYPGVEPTRGARTAPADVDDGTDSRVEVPWQAEPDDSAARYETEFGTRPNDVTTGLPPAQTVPIIRFGW